MSNTIKIPFSIPSRNDVDELYWAARGRLMKSYIPFIRQEMSHYRLKKATEKQVYKIEVTTFRKRLLRDHTNLVGGFKQMEDALVHEGFIYDDAEKYIGKPSITQQKATEECTIITREEI